MPARAIMFQGTGSNVGKSLIVAGLARALANRGMKVAPFKPQNMSNNAAVTVDGGEIGRAQATQALAARIAPTVHMNPLLLKPETGAGAQVIVNGKRHDSMSARAFFACRQRFLPAILDSFHTLAESFDFVLVEGAGSPAEINLRHGDIANMGFATAADVPVALIGDIHRGGVMAAIVGTFAIIDRADAERIKTFIINNFHGDVELFRDGVSYLEDRLLRPCCGIVRHFGRAGELPAEDTVALETDAAPRKPGAPLKIAAPRLSRMANFDDLDPLRAESAVDLVIVGPGRPLPADCDLIILPGSKSTRADLADLRQQGWDIDIKAHVRRGGCVFAICGGYQMAGRIVRDPHGLEGEPGESEGLGLLDVETELAPAKTLALSHATHCRTGAAIAAYQIHLGHTRGADCQRPFAMIADKPDGATSPDGRVVGTYLHGCFTGDDFRRRFLADLGATGDGIAHNARIDAVLDALAAHLEADLDVDRLLDIAGAGARRP